MGPLQPGVDAAFCATRAFGRTLALVHPAAWSYGSHRTQCPPVTVVIVEERIEQHLVGRRPDHGELAWRQGRTPQTCVLTDTPLNKQLLLEEKIVMTTGESQRAEYFGLRAVLRHVV